MDITQYRVEPGADVELSTHDTDGATALGISKKEGKAATKELNKRVEELQEILYAEGKHKVLFVLQAMDTGGKDGTIRHVFDGVNPQGVDVASFKKPTEHELSHDYLWRVHRQAPHNGQIVIFNRSHYEDVLVVRVRELVPAERWEQRYGHINDFERLLADEGTTIVKIYLHISHEEQRERLQSRIDTPRKRWKFNSADLAERKLWSDYQEAYEAVLERTSTDHAPWYIVPADRKWFRNLVVSQIVVDTLERLDPAYPPAEDDIDGLVVPPL